MTDGKGREKQLLRLVIAGLVLLVAALPAIIETYQAAGFTFRTLSPQVRAVTFSYPNPKQGD